jgi:uncharacterized protein (DUF2147 family)
MKSPARDTDWLCPLAMERVWVLARTLATLLAGATGAGIGGEPSRADAPNDITGVWLTDDGEGAVEIQPCGEQRCGRIVWMKNPRDEHGRIPTDQNNRDPKLRSRKICGLTIIDGLKHQSDGGWGEGHVYNPDNGQTYGVEIRRMAPEILKVTGYLGFRFLGEAQEWRRAPKNLSVCGDEVKREIKR